MSPRLSGNASLQGLAEVIVIANLFWQKIHFQSLSHNNHQAYCLLLILTWKIICLPHRLFWLPVLSEAASPRTRRKNEGKAKIRIFFSLLILKYISSLYFIHLKSSSDYCRYVRRELPKDVSTRVQRSLSDILRLPSRHHWFISVLFEKHGSTMEVSWSLTPGSAQNQRILDINQIQVYP